MNLSGKGGFDARLAKTNKRHHGARSLFDSALSELESAAEEFDQLFAAIEQERERLYEQSEEALAGYHRARRVAEKIRALLS